MMEGCSSNNGEACLPTLLDLIPKERREWVGHKESGDVLEMSPVEKKLQLRLGLPGDDDDNEWSLGNKTSSARNMNRNRERRDESSLLSLGYFNNHHYHYLHHQQAPKVSSHEIQQIGSPAAASSSSVWFNQQQAPPSSFLQFPTTKTEAADKQQSLLGTVAKESSQPCCTKVGAVDLQQSVAEKKAFSPPPPANTAVLNTSQKRTAPEPVVGWPPIRSFRKNLASGSSFSKQQQQQPAVNESKNGNPNKKAGSEKPVQVCKKGLFVKINMDGVSIGRKVDLTAYNSYQRLSVAVDDLFRGLLAAQRDPNCDEMVKKQEEEEKAITGLFDGSGEYTLVYEDNEGDRMLVGDVPWQMFVSTVKRLRVLKSSEVSGLTLGCNKQEKMMK